MTVATIKAPTTKLTGREAEILALTAHGKTRGEISTILSIKEETVKAYIERGRIKLNAANKTHAVAIAITLNLIVPFKIQLGKPLPGGKGLSPKRGL
ncbi:MAG: helix-turn-helix transcriptional regulator [Alphaproteobacteria bacterium]